LLKHCFQQFFFFNFFFHFQKHVSIRINHTDSWILKPWPQDKQSSQGPTQLTSLSKPGWQVKKYYHILKLYPMVNCKIILFREVLVDMSVDTWICGFQKKILREQILWWDLKFMDALRTKYMKLNVLKTIPHIFLRPTWTNLSSTPSQNLLDFSHLQTLTEIFLKTLQQSQEI